MSCSPSVKAYRYNNAVYIHTQSDICSWSSWVHRYLATSRYTTKCYHPVPTWSGATTASLVLFSTLSSRFCLMSVLRAVFLSCTADVPWEGTDNSFGLLLAVSVLAADLLLLLWTSFPGRDDVECCGRELEGQCTMEVGLEAGNGLGGEVSGSFLLNLEVWGVLLWVKAFGMGILDSVETGNLLKVL